MKALVIVGHGSHLNEDSSLPVYEHAQHIREAGGFDEVVECFWKEEPSMRHVLDTVESDEVYVVPAFISEGYFTQQVIPRELGLEGPVTRKRSEEHTSELQSRQYLVCRLLLEKKKKKHQTDIAGPSAGYPHHP